MSFVHNSAKVGEIAEVVLMCGDPLRVQYIAENFLEDAKLVSSVRNMYCYTGNYKGKQISVMGSGMGVPSMGIYSHELFDIYGVKAIIRVGTCGAYQEDVKVRDLVVAIGSSSNSSYPSQFQLNGSYSAIADFGLLKLCDDVCTKKKVKAHFGNIYTSDVFYNADTEFWKKWAEMGCLAVDMETYALYINAARFRRKALSIMSVSDSFIYDEIMTPEERETGLHTIVEIALETALGV